MYMYICTTFANLRLYPSPGGRGKGGVCPNGTRGAVSVNERDFSRLEVKVNKANGHTNGAKNGDGALHIPGGNYAADTTLTNAHRGHPHPLDSVVVDHPGSGAILRMQTGLFELGRNRAGQSGATKPVIEDQRALEEHARTMAREVN